MWYLTLQTILLASVASCMEQNVASVALLSPAAFPCILTYVFCGVAMGT